MIPGRVDHHVGIWHIIGHTDELTHVGGSLFEVKSYTFLSFHSADEAAFTNGPDTLNLIDISVMTGILMFYKSTYHRPFWKYEYMDLAND